MFNAALAIVLAVVLIHAEHYVSAMAMGVVAMVSIFFALGGDEW